jgi:hypothetical protein
LSLPSLQQAKMQPPDDHLKPDTIGRNIFPEIQLRDASSDETFLIQFLKRYDTDPLLLQACERTA